MKCVQIRSFSWSVFSRIRTGYGEISLRIQSECGKIRTRKNSVFGHFSHSVLYKHNVKQITESARTFHYWLKTHNAKNTVNSPDFLVWKYCGKASPKTIRPKLFAQNYAETVPFHKISAPGNQVKLRYFT